MPSSDLTARMYYDQGVSAAARGDHNNASEYYRKAVERDAMYVEAHQKLAETYEQMGYANRAKKAWGALQRIAKDAELVALCAEKMRVL